MKAVMKVTKRAYQISPACTHFLHCAQGATDTQITDRSGKGNHVDKGTGQTWDNVTGTYGVWGTQGRARIYEHTDATRCWIAQKSWWEGFKSTQGHALLLFWRAEFTRPGGTRSLLRLGVSSSLPGINLRMGSNGTLDVLVRTSAASLLDTASTTQAIAGSGSESCAVLVDGSANRVDIWVNGVQQTSQTDTLPTDGDVIQSTTPASGFFGNTDGSIALSMQEFHSYVITRVPSDIDALVSSLHSRLYTPLQAHEVAA